MGILNLTPDSFAGSAPADVSAAVAQALEMEADGADIIDAGGESTRPGAAPVSGDQELARVLPVISALSGRLKVPLSIDTSKASVAQAAVDAGAVIIGDVTGLRGDPALAGIAAASGAALVLVHTRGTPQTMTSQAVYDDLVGEIAAEIRERIAVAVASARSGGRRPTARG